MKLRVGTRGSRLAIAQTNLAMEALRRVDSSLEFEMIEIKTEGDIRLDVTLDLIGGKGVFVKEIERALLERTIDIAVHSMKDMPSDFPEGLGLGACLDREDPADVYVGRDGSSIRSLDPGAKVATCSVRRNVQLLELRPDLEIVPVRGNVNTRLKKLDEGHFQGMLLAAAGLIRLGLQDRISDRFSPDEFIPSPCQGTIGIEYRLENKKIGELLKQVNSKDAWDMVDGERGFLAELGGNCKLPAGAYSTLIGSDEILIKGMLAECLDCTNLVLRDEIRGPRKDGRLLGAALAKSMKSRLTKEMACERSELQNGRK